MDENNTAIDWSPLAELRNHTSGLFKKPTKMYVDCGPIDMVVMATNPLDACIKALRKHVESKIKEESPLAEGQKFGILDMQLKNAFYVSLSGTSGTYDAIQNGITSAEVIKEIKDECLKAHSGDWQVETSAVIKFYQTMVQGGNIDDMFPDTDSDAFPGA